MGGSISATPPPLAVELTIQTVRPASRGTSRPPRGSARPPPARGGRRRRSRPPCGSTDSHRGAGSGISDGQGAEHHGRSTSTAAPWSRPHAKPRRVPRSLAPAAAAVAATSSREIGARRGRIRSPSHRGREFATERTTRSPHSEVVGERWDRAHVDPGADHRSALGDGRERRRHERTDRGEDDRGVERLRRPRSVERPAHSAPSSRAKAWPSASPWRVKANSRRPWCRATWATMWAAGAEAVDARAARPHPRRRSAR